MKRFLLAVLFLASAVLFVEPAQILFSNFLRLDQPTTYEIKKGDWISKIAQRYYGDASYWKELELINRAPNGNLVYPGEKIIVPSFSAIRKIRKTRRLSDVNGILDFQEELLSGRMPSSTEPVPVFEREAETAAAVNEAPEKVLTANAADEWAGEQVITKYEALPEREQAETPLYRSTAVVTGVVVLAVIAIMGLLLFTRKKQKEEIVVYGEPSEDEKETEKTENNKDESRYFFEDFKSDSSEKEEKKAVEIL
ncbi:MAG: LysM peptidoglycan-binding domain-containing protein [bacterium]